MTTKLFHEAPGERQFEATVIARRQTDGAWWVALDRTHFYPLSGGQLADRGTLAGQPVLEVVEEGDGTIWHRVAERIDGERVPGEIDWAARIDHTQQHSGQHLLSAALIERYGAPTLSFHMGAATSTIDVEGLEATPEQLAEVEELCARVIAEHRPVRVHSVARDELYRFRLRKPPQVDGMIRLIEIDAFDVSPCGGTHVSTSAAIEALAIAGSERVKKGLARLTFRCGGRVRRDHRAKTALVAALCAELSQTEDGLAARVHALAAQARDLSKQCELSRRELLALRAQGLAAEARASGRTHVTRCEPDATASDLETLGRALVAGGVIAILGGGAPQARLYFAAPAGVPVSMKELLERALPHVEGRGGGSAATAQGGGPAAIGVAAALAAAEQALLARLHGNQA